MAREWRVLAIRWCGVAAKDFGPMRDFAVETLGLEVKHEAADLLVADAGNGDRFEVFGPNSPSPDWQFTSSPVMVGFLVDDIEAARQQLIESGLEMLGPLSGGADGMRWQHFRAPNGVAFELTWDARISG